MTSHVIIDSGDSDDEYHCSSHLPDQDSLRAKLATVDKEDHSKILWQALYDHSKHNNQATAEWYPAYDVVQALLFFFTRKAKTILLSLFDKM